MSIYSHISGDLYTQKGFTSPIYRYLGIIQPGSRGDSAGPQPRRYAAYTNITTGELFYTNFGRWEAVYQRVGGPDGIRDTY